MSALTEPLAFKAALPPVGRLLCLDVGDKTIGLALSDGSRMVASPLETIERKKLAKDLETLKTIIARHAVCGLVVGHPLNMDGSSGPRAQSVRTFVSNLQKQVALPVLLWDERLSTAAAERAMLEADLSRQRRAQLVDKLAASYMLQGLLDSLRA